MRKGEISQVSLISYVVLAVAFLLQVAIARILGIERFGVYSATLAAVALVEVPFVLRGGELAIRVLGEAWANRDPDRIKSAANQMLRRDLCLYTLIFLFASTVAWILQNYTGVDAWLFTILALVIPAQTGFGIYKSYFIIFNRIAEMARYELIYSITLFCINIMGALLFGIYGLAFAMVISTLFKTYLAYRFTKTYLPKGNDLVTFNNMHRSWKKDEAISITRNTFFNGLAQIDIVLLSAVQRPEVVALYKVGKSLASLPIKIAFPIWRYVQPSLVTAVQKGDDKKVKQVILTGSGIIALVMIVLFPLCFVFAEPIIVTLYGEVYRESFKHFIILLLGVWVFHGLAGWFKLWVVVTNQRSYGIIVYAIACVAIVIFGLEFGGDSFTGMAWVMSAVFAGISIAAFARELFS